jgi:uncharacterized protein (DUF2141 family)
LTQGTRSSFELFTRTLSPLICRGNFTAVSITMSRIFIFLSVFSSLSFIKPAGGTLTITITDCRTDKGHILVSLFKTADGFPDNPAKSFQHRQVQISNKNAVAEFAPLPDGDYAISVLHDENDDQKMNKTWLGLPKEGYGFSNNVMGALGPPSFSKASFTITVKTNKTIAIRLRY